MKKDIAVLIKYRLNQAKESLEEARALLKESMSFRSVMNRLYYAMFYAVLALFQFRGLAASKHSGVISLFDLEFVKSGIFNREMSWAIHRAFELRQKGDYVELYEITKGDVEKCYLDILEYIKKMNLCL